MITERVAKSPWLFAGALVVAAALGALLFVALQALMPSSFGERAQVERVVRDYLLEHPEILPEAMERLQKRQEAAAITKLPALAKPYEGASAGNPNGDVTIVAFLDYNCGYCRVSIPILTRLVQSDPKLRVVYREYPVLGDESVLAARWALAAARQGKFMPYHETLYSLGRASPETIHEAAAKAGLDVAKAQSTIDSKGVEAEIATNYQYGRALQLTGTPGWVIGKRLYQGAMSYDELVKAVAEARKG